MANVYQHNMYIYGYTRFDSLPETPANQHL